MACKTTCKLCDRLVISQAVTFTGGNLVINLPAGSYRNGEKYCVVIAQAIPAATTINAPVVVTIGTGTELYPLINRCCAQVTACGVRTRTRYSAVVSTSAVGGTFKLLGKTCPCPDNRLDSINGTAPPRLRRPRPERRKYHEEKHQNAADGLRQRWPGQ